MSEVPYAGELSQQLLKHAEKLEKLYKKLGQAMATNAAEKVIKSFLAEVEEANAFTSKARPGVRIVHCGVVVGNHWTMWIC